MKRFKTVAELNMEVNVEPTLEAKTQELMDWVTDKLKVCETFLSITGNRLEHLLCEAEAVRDETIDYEFDCIYGTINEFCSTVKWKGEMMGISDEVMSCCIAEFKQIKSKARKLKIRYKEAFAYLREEINKSMENEVFVAKVTNQVHELITSWCNTHVIIDYYKKDYVGEALLKTVEYVTKLVLSRKLYPSNEDVISFVEKHMGYYTVVNN